MSAADRLTDEEREALANAADERGWAMQSNQVSDEVLAHADATFWAAVERILAARGVRAPGDTTDPAPYRGSGSHRTQAEWAEWSNGLALLLDDDVIGRYANPEAAQESIIEDCLRGLVEDAPDVCDTCDGEGETLTMVPGSTGEPIEGVVPCPDCVDRRPRNDGIARPAPDTLAARVQALADQWAIEAAAGRSGGGHSLLIQSFQQHADALRALLAGRPDASPEGGEQRG